MLVPFLPSLPPLVIFLFLVTLCSVVGCQVGYCVVGKLAADYAQAPLESRLERLGRCNNVAMESSAAQRAVELTHELHLQQARPRNPGESAHSHCSSPFE